MASQRKVDSAGRRAAERREGSSSSDASDTSASGTYAAPDEARTSSAEDAAFSADEQASVSERVAATAAKGDEETVEAELPAARVSSIEQLGVRAASGDDDESVSLDELLISDSSDSEEDEEEATDIHPGLSELADSLSAGESLRSIVVPRSLEQPAEPLVAPEETDAERDAEPVSEVTAASPELAPEALEPVAEEEPPPDAADPDPEEALVSASAEELPAEAEPALEAAAAAAGAEAVAEDDVEEMEAAPESEAAMEVELAPESVPLHDDVSEPEATAEAEAVLAADLELDETTAEPPAAAPVAAQSERQTLPEPLAAKRRDAPLPSFDIPEIDAAAARRGQAQLDSRARPAALPALSEDDDDAVTHMGLPVVPEVANDYPAAGYPGADYPAAAAVSGFAVADPSVAALQSLDADIARGDSRRATTRVIPRLDPKTLPARPRQHAPGGAPIGERLLGLARDAWGQLSNLLPATSSEPGWGAELSPGRRRLSWLVENVLPPLSLVLFGSGLGAGVIMLVDNDGPMQAQAVQSLQESAPSAARGPLTLADRARTGDGEALYKITNMPHAERTSALTLALEAGYQAQKQKEFREFVKASSNGSAPLPPSAVTRIVEYATSSETMLPAFQELTQWPGSAGPDLLYSVWEKAAGGSRAASLAQQLLYSTDQRAKATPALLVALDLRSATTCEDYLGLLPAVVRDGDQRSSATLRSLRHSDGCGADGKQDCYPCLRDTPLLDDALKAVERR